MDACNAIARRVCGEADIAINDLHAAVAGGNLAGLLTGDGVHFTEDGYRTLGGIVAERIRELLP